MSNGRSWLHAVVVVAVALAQPLPAQKPADTEMISLLPQIGPMAPPHRERPEDRVLMLRSGPVDVRALAPAMVNASTQDALAMQGLTTADVSYYITKFAPDVLPQQARRMVEVAGGEIVGYIPHNAYMVRGRGDALLPLANRPGCDVATAFHPADRIESRLALQLTRWRNRNRDPITFIVDVAAFPGEDAEQMAQQIANLNLPVRNSAPDRGLGASFQVVCPGPLIPWVASLPGVQWVEQAFPAQVCCDHATGSGGSGVDLLNIADLATAYGLNGSGMIVGHADTGLDIGEDSTSLHPDFLTEDGSATRLLYARGWGLRTDEPLWMDTYDSGGSAFEIGPRYLLDSWDSGAASGTVRAVTVWLKRSASPLPYGSVLLRLYKNSALPTSASHMAGTPTATSSTWAYAGFLPTSSYAATTFYFDPGVTVSPGETWWVVVDLDFVWPCETIQVLRKYAPGTGAAMLYGTDGPWQTLNDYALACRVYGELRWDDADGHGTHTLGIIAGNGRAYAPGGVPRYCGPAPRASFVHQSLQDGTSALGGLPYDTFQLFEEAYTHGARVHSDSWASNAHGTYTRRSQQVDSYAWYRPDFLPVLAAGDGGLDGRWLEPATPQDTEQALNNAYENHAFRAGVVPRIRSVVLSMRRDAAASGTISAELWGWCPSVGPICFCGSLGSVDVSELPTDGLRPVEFTGSAWPGGPEQWVHLIWTSRSGTVYVGCNGSGTNNYAYYPGAIPWSFTSNRQAVQLVPGDGVVDGGSIGAPATAKNCLAVGASETSRLANPAGYDSLYSTDSYNAPIGGESCLDDPGGIAAFSSRGPTYDGRCKPDLVAPGTYIASCRSQRIPPVMADDVEQGTGNFNVGTYWTRYDPAPSDTYQARSGSWCYRGRGTDGDPFGYLTCGADLTTQPVAGAGLYLCFWVIWIASGDEVYLELSNDGGATWHSIGPDGIFWSTTSASILPYAQQRVRIPASYYTSTFRFRFRYHDTSGTNHGLIYLDDFAIWQPNSAVARLNCLQVPGWDDYSGGAGGRYEFRSGTSIAAALTSGVATLVREYYVEKKGLASPSAALIKATLINEAVDLSPGQYGTGSTQELQPRPDYSQGWGGVNAKGCLYRTAPRIGGYVEADGAWAFTSPGQSQVIELAVPDIPENRDEPVKVTLAWTDRPGSLFASPCLVDDLDLKVEHLSNATFPNKGEVDATWYGNGNAAGDSVNNVEQVDIPAPVAFGWYRITISCTVLPYGGTQPWALVASGGFTNDPAPTPVEVDDLRAAWTSPHSVTVSWFPVAGLDIVDCRASRSESVGGPFEPTAGEVRRRAGRYEVIDSRVQRDKTYYYRVELMDSGGHTTHSEVVSVE